MKEYFFLKDNELDLFLKSRIVMIGKIDMFLGCYWYNWIRGFVLFVDYLMLKFMLYENKLNELKLYFFLIFFILKDEEIVFGVLGFVDWIGILYLMK